MGSIRDARRAGIAAAMIDTVSKRNVVQEAVSGSAASRPYNVDPIKRTIKSAAPSPSSIPTSVSTIDSPRTAVSTEVGCAPKAILNPISLRPSFDHLALDGILDGYKASFHLTKVDEKKFLLESRGFHWVQDYPFNR